MKAFTITELKLQLAVYQFCLQTPAIDD